MNHLQQRLAERNMVIDTSKLYAIASGCNEDSAVIIQRLENHAGDNVNSYYDRKESNGDLVILIVRNRIPYTIMYRRSNQKNTPDAMRVKKIVDLTH